MNGRLLKSKMILYGDEKFSHALSELLNIARQTASAKLTGESEFTQTEIAIISKHYHLSDSEIRDIFIGDDKNEHEEITVKLLNN